MTTVAVFTGSRADLSPLGPVIAALDADPRTPLTVLVGPGHTLQAVREELHFDGMPDPHLRSMGPTLDRVGPAEQLVTGAALLNELADALAGVDVLVVLGDRWELLFVVPAAVLLGVRVVHLHGGEVTEGAVDERVRHAVTKLADQHCVASPDAARRVARLGESADRIHRTGAPGLDRLVVAAPMTDAEFADTFGVRLRRPLALFTYHPPTAVTADPDLLETWAGEALEATLERCGTVVATHPGLDVGHDVVRSVLDAADAAGHLHLVVRPSLGSLYPRLLATADVMVGNSSSGIVEAGACRLPVVDVGDRQRGRLADRNVVHVPEGREGVTRGLERTLASGFATSLIGMVSSYGDGHAAAAVLEVVVAAPEVARAKHFADENDDQQPTVGRGRGRK